MYGRFATSVIGLLVSRLLSAIKAAKSDSKNSLSYSFSIRFS
jgi:hypothetical protein